GDGRADLRARGPQSRRLHRCRRSRGSSRPAAGIRGGRRQRRRQDRPRRAGTADRGADLSLSQQSILVTAARRGRQLVKTAVNERASRLLQREARWLRELESVAELEGQVPRVLDE